MARIHGCWWSSIAQEFTYSWINAPSTQTVAFLISMEIWTSAQFVQHELECVYRICCWIANSIWIITQSRRLWDNYQFEYTPRFCKKAMELRTSPLAQDNLGIAITHMDKPTHSLIIPFCKRPDVLTHRTATNFQTTTHLNIPRILPQNYSMELRTSPLAQHILHVHFPICRKSTHSLYHPDKYHVA